MNFYTNVTYYRNQILLRGYDRGQRVQEKVSYRPYVFLPTKKQSSFRTLDGALVEKKTFASIKEARDFIKMYGEAENARIYGLTNFVYTFINDEYPGQVEYDPDLIKVVSIDIETRSDQGFPDPTIADQEVLAVSLRQRGKTVAIGLKPYQSQDRDVLYIRCDDEVSLLLKFLSIWSDPDWSPDVVTGWNIDSFDVPYLINRITRVLGSDYANKMSPWGVIESREIIRGKSMARSGSDRSDVVYQIYGLTCLDYLELYKKFSFTNQESYSLDHISYVVLGEKKVDYKSYGYKNLTELYDKNFDLFIEYNIQDSVLVDRLEEKLGFIKQVFALAYDAKVNYIDTMTTVKSWDVIIHNYLLDQGVVIPQRVDSDFEEFVGGFVKDPQVGMHDWVVSFDLNSLYPHLIMQYNISPETFVRKDQHFPPLQAIIDEYAVLDSEHTNAANGCRYLRDHQGFLPALMEKMYDDRSRYKQMMIESKKRLEEIKEEMKRRDINE